MKITLSVFLVVSIALNAILAYELNSISFENEIPSFSSEEKAVLEKALGIIGSSYPIGTYPYKVELGDEGNVVKFQDYAFLQLMSSALRSATIFDGCVYFHFNKEFSDYVAIPCG